MTFLFIYLFIFFFFFSSTFYFSFVFLFNIILLFLFYSLFYLCLFIFFTFSLFNTSFLFYFLFYLNYLPSPSFILHSLFFILHHLSTSFIFPSSHSLQFLFNTKTLHHFPILPLFTSLFSSTLKSPSFPRPHKSTSRLWRAQDTPGDYKRHIRDYVLPCPASTSERGRWHWNARPASRPCTPRPDNTV